MIFVFLSVVTVGYVKFPQLICSRASIFGACQ